MKMDIKNMVRDFASLGEAKKRSSVYVLSLIHISEPTRH